MKQVILILLFSIFISSCETIRNKDYNFDQKEYVQYCFTKSKEIIYKAEIEDYWQSPDESALLKTGDCEDQAFYLQNLLVEKNIKSRVVVGYTYSIDPIKDWKEEKSMHAWNEVEINGDLYILDMTSFVFNKKSELKSMYNWDVTKNKDVLSSLTPKIRLYLNKLDSSECKKIANSIRESFNLK